MSNTFTRIFGVLLYMIVFFLLMNMGRKKNKNTKEFAFLCAVIFFMLLLIRSYENTKLFNEHIYISLKAALCGMIGLSLSNLIASVFRITALKKKIRILAIILGGSELLFLPLYAFFNMKIALYLLYLTLLGTGLIFLIVSTD